MKLNWKQYHKKERAWRIITFSNLFLCEILYCSLSGILNKATREKALRIRLISQCWSQRGTRSLQPPEHVTESWKRDCHRGSSNRQENKYCTYRREQAPRKCSPRAAEESLILPGWKGHVMQMSVIVQLASIWPLGLAATLWTPTRSYSTVPA